MRDGWGRWGQTTGNYHVIRDTVAPTISMSDVTIKDTEATSYNLMTGVSVADNSGVTPTVTTSGSLSSTPGTYTITYTVRDAARNTVVKNRTITVKQSVIPIGDVYKNYQRGCTDTIYGYIDGVGLVTIEQARKDYLWISWGCQYTTHIPVNEWKTANATIPNSLFTRDTSVKYIASGPNSLNKKEEILSPWLFIANDNWGCCSKFPNNSANLWRSSALPDDTWAYSALHKAYPGSSDCTWSGPIDGDLYWCYNSEIRRDGLGFSGGSGTVDNPYIIVVDTN